MQAEPVVAHTGATQQVVVRLSTIEELLARGGALFEAHYREICRIQDIARLRPDWGRLKQLERTRSLLVLGAWAGVNLVGYSVTIISQHLHYADLTCGHVDVVFVAAEHRRNGVGLELIRHTERLAAGRGVQLLTMHAKPETALEAVLPRIGYRVEEITFSRRLV